MQIVDLPPQRTRRAEDAVTRVCSGDRVLVQRAVATPTELVDAMMARPEEPRGIEIVHLHIGLGS